MRRPLALAVVLAAGLAAAGDGAAGRSVLAVETAWRGEDGARVSLSKWKGRWYVLSFVYTSCAGSCPLTTKKLLRLDAALQKAGKPLPTVIVSLDPAHDTPAEVAKYRERYGLTGAPRFSVLVGDDEQVRSLSLLLDFRYTRNPESGVILHDNVVYLVAPDGTVRTHMSSLAEPLADFVDAVPAPAPRR
ncbi:MAG: SCO family protein [Myxococcales bacterium]|nr:SCO family protein [Myxococcales bacterium]